MTRLAIVILLLSPVAAVGQIKEKDDDKVSNDQPDRPLQMPPASTEVKEALDDFERFQRRSAWERALKSLYTIPEEQTHRFIDGEKGFIIPVARKRHSILMALPPQGQSAYRLFYDAEARKLFEDARGPSELKSLERIYSAYFLTAIGDNAADRLGDLYFELGHFDRAADCWMTVVRERPDTDLSPALLNVKAGLALFRAGRDSEFEQIRTELADRRTDEKLTIGGQTGTPVELLDRLVKEDQNATAAEKPPPRAGDNGLDLAGQVDPVWQMRFAASVEAGMSPAELTQWESTSVSVVVPAVTIDGSMLFVNYLGYVFALDLKTGKMLWRSASFHHLEASAMQNYALDPGRFAIVAAGEYLWSLGRDLKDQNFMAPFSLTCRRASSGEVVWQSTDLADYAQIDLAGRPLLAGGKLFIAGKGVTAPQQQQGMPQQLVLAIQPHDGKVLWKSEIGTFRQDNRFNYYNYNRDPAPQPRIVYRAGTLYIDTQLGVFARLDADSGTVDWGYGYKTDPLQGQNRFMFFNGMPQPETTAAGSEPLRIGDAFLLKGMQSTRLYAIEPNRMKFLWERPISKSARLLGASDRAVFLGGAEISAMDLHTRQLLWSTPLPSGSMDARVLVRPDGLWQLTPRGIVEIDPKSGAIRRIFRGADLGAAGGDLVLTDPFLLAVSNRTISAYPRRAAGSTASVPDRAATTKERASK
ncbi:MAG: PQQ-binding-like beta-propeller repeat protein [Isosphaerales bacterium]